MFADRLKKFDNFDKVEDCLTLTVVKFVNMLPDAAKSQTNVGGQVLPQKEVQLYTAIQLIRSPSVLSARETERPATNMLNDVRKKFAVARKRMIWGDREA